MMQKYNNTRIIIGLDHGYGNIKTAHRGYLEQEWNVLMKNDSQPRIISNIG